MKPVTDQEDLTQEEEEARKARSERIDAELQASDLQGWNTPYFKEVDPDGDSYLEYLESLERVN